MAVNNDTAPLRFGAVGASEKLLPPSSDAAAPASEAALHGTGAADVASGGDASPSSSAPTKSPASVTPFVFTTTTSTTTLIASLRGGNLGSGSGSASSKSGLNNGETEDILPWILCFGIGLILIWIGWMLRQYISRKCCGAEQQRSESNRNVHWQWISTGNPHSGSLLPRHKPGSNDTKVDLTEVDPGGFRILIGGDMTPGSGMTPIASQAMISPDQQMTSLSKHDFNHLLGRVCSISDPTVKLQTFELTFDNIQLGDWTKDEWEKFTHKLFDLHPKVNTILENKNGYIQKRSVLDEWLNWQTVEKADMRDIYEALEAADKVDVAHNAAISVTLELRQAAGRITSECVDVMSECSEQPNNEELEILEEEEEADDDDDEGEEEMTPTNSVKAAFSPNRRPQQHKRTNHNRDSRTSETSWTNHKRESETSSAIRVGIGRESGLGLEDRLLTNSSSTLPRATTEAQQHSSATQQHPSPDLLHSSSALHHSSPARQGSLNDSVGNSDTVHSTEKLIHV